MDRRAENATAVSYTHLIVHMGMLLQQIFCIQQEPGEIVHAGHAVIISELFKLLFALVLIYHNIHKQKGKQPDHTDVKKKRACQNRVAAL